MYSLENYAQFQATTNPILAAITDNPYANYQARGSNHQGHFLKTAHRPLTAASSNWQEAFTSGGPSGYGPSSSGYDQQHYPPAAISSHSGGGHSGPSGYAAPHPPHSHPPADHRPPSSSLSFGKFKKGGNSAMTALTLLSFFFFVNLLQTCLKEHMNTINPTVMVMTSSFIKNRSNKLAEMNSREHHKSPALTATDAQIVIQPEDLISAAASVVPVTVATTLTLQSPYSDGAMKQQSSILENHLKLQNPYVTPASTINTLDYNSQYEHSNRTSMPSYTSFDSSTEKHRPQFDYPTNGNHYTPAHGISDAYPWSHHRDSLSTTSSNNRYNSPYSVSSSNSYYGGSSNYYDRQRDRDRYDDRNRDRNDDRNRDRYNDRNHDRYDDRNRDRYDDRYFTRIN